MNPEDDETNRPEDEPPLVTEAPHNSESYQQGNKTT